MAYVPKLKGYIADVPEFHFTRIDGTKFCFNQLTQASVTPNVNFTEVNSGWNLYPSAYLPAASTLEAQLTSGEFDASLFELANGETFATDSTYKMPVTETLTVSSNTVTLSSTTNVSASIVINGMTVVTTAPTTSGTYLVTSTGDDTVTTTITFYTGDFANGAQVEVHYDVLKSAAKSIGVSNDKAAIGAADLIWPVYTGGENVTGSTSFGGSSIIGYIVMHIYRCRVTQMPGFDTSLTCRLLVQ